LAKDQCYVPVSYEQRINSGVKDTSLTPLDSVCINYENQPAINSDNTKGQQTIVRDKDPIEQGLCIAIPQPEDCKEIIADDKDPSNATWPGAKYGEQSQGTCINGYTGNPTRYCVVNPDTGLSNFGKITSPCQELNFCLEWTNNGITYSKTDYGTTVTGTCPANTVPDSNNPPKATCYSHKPQDGSPGFDSLTGECLGGCVAWTDPNTGILYPPQEFGKISIGQCPVNMISSSPSAPPQAMCDANKPGFVNASGNGSCIEAAQCPYVEHYDGNSKCESYGPSPIGTEFKPQCYTYAGWNDICTCKGDPYKGAQWNCVLNR
jgi:hypothetical protein